MKRIPASIIVFLTAIVPAVAAETTEPGESLPDTYPACMEVNGPDCVLRSQYIPPPTAAPQGVVILPAAAPPVSATPGTSNLIVPARGSTIIPPRQ